MDPRVEKWQIIRFNIKNGEASVLKDLTCSEALAKRLCQKYQAMFQYAKDDAVVYFPHQVPTSLVGVDGSTPLGA